MAVEQDLATGASAAGGAATGAMTGAKMGAAVAPALGPLAPVAPVVSNPWRFDRRRETARQRKASQPTANLCHATTTAATGRRDDGRT